MAKKETKTWSSFTPAYRSRVVKDFFDTITGKTKSQEEITGFLTAIIRHIERDSLRSNAVPANVIEPAQAGKLVENFSQLRERVGTHHSQAHLPRLSVNDLDQAIVSSGLSLESMKKFGYTLSKSKFGALSSGQSTSSRVGRKSKVWNKELVDKVNKFLAKYLNDSYIVVVVRKHGRKELVCAKLLTKKLGRIWNEEPGLRSLIGLTALWRIMRIHFPSVRPPGRKTDVCGHCRVFKRHIIPRAEKEYKKRRARLSWLLPAAPFIFWTFWSKSWHRQFATVCQHGRNHCACTQVHITTQRPKWPRPLARTTSWTSSLRFVPMRSQGMPQTQRSLWTHPGICLAQAISAERQRDFSSSLLENLPSDEAYFHFDF